MPHDIDRTQLEFGSELSEYGEVPGLVSDQYEYSSELGNIMNEVLGGTYGESYEGGYQEYQELPLPEVMEDEMASRLLEIRSDQELDHFLGDLFKKVAGGLGKVIKGPIGQALGGVLKQVAKQALPTLGTAVGGFFGDRSEQRWEASWLRPPAVHSAWNMKASAARIASSKLPGVMCALPGRPRKRPPWHCRTRTPRPWLRPR